MPYKSDKQRRFMHARHPKIAARWDKEYGGTVADKKKPKVKKAAKKAMPMAMSMKKAPMKKGSKRGY